MLGHRGRAARRALTASLCRLGTDHIDLYQLHPSDADPAPAAELRDACEEFVRGGLVRAYGRSTDDPARPAVFAGAPGCPGTRTTAPVPIPGGRPLTQGALAWLWVRSPRTVPIPCEPLDRVSTAGVPPPPVRSA